MLFLAIRLLLIGPHGCGKTAIRRAMLHQPFPSSYKRGFLSKHETYMHIDNTSIPVELWDASEESWPALTQLIVDVVLLCIDISDRKSLDKVWNTEVRSSILHSFLFQSAAEYLVYFVSFYN